MPQINIRTHIKNVSSFHDITHYFRLLGKSIYMGYVRHDDFSCFIGDYPILQPYIEFSEYMYKGDLRRRKTLNFPYTVGRYITNNMYAEMPDYLIEGNEGETVAMNNILNRNNWNVREKDNFETQFHIGDRIIKPYVQNSELKLDYITGDLFYATKIDNGEIISGVFPTFREIKKGNKTIYYTRLEWHYEMHEENDPTLDGINTVGRVIKTELYKSEKAGRLDTLCHPQEHLWLFGTQINAREEFLDLDIPTFIVIKNPQQNNKDLHDGRGIGGVINTLDSLISLDEAFNSKSNDNVYGGIKTMVPERITDEVVDSKGKTHRHYDPTDPEIFVYADEGMDGSKPEVFAPVLRTEQFVASIQMDLDITSTNIGVSAGSFRFDGKSIVTATQKIIEKSDTARTIKEFENSNSEGYKKLFMLIKWYSEKNLIMENFTFEENDINISWKDNIAIDDEKFHEDMKKDSDDGYLSKWRYIASKYGLPEEVAKQWVKEAQEEEESASLSLFGSEGFNDEDESEQGSDEVNE